MFRFFLPSSRLLFRKPLSALTFAPEVTGSAADTVVTIYDVRRYSHHKHRRETLPRPLAASRLLPLFPQYRDDIVRYASDRRGFKIPDPAQIACNFISMLKCVDLQDMKDAPPTAFWATVAVGGGQLVIPFLEIIGGYSPVLTLLQLNTAAVTLGFVGGTKWGLAVSDNPTPTPTWETMRWALLPSAVAVTGLLLPYPLGFLTVASGMVTSLYLDLKSCAFPPWALAIKAFMTLATVTGLMLALSAYVIFHNREKGKKQKEKAGRKELAEKEEEDEVDGKGKSKVKADEQSQTDTADK